MKDSAKTFSHLAHISILSQYSGYMRVSRLMNSLQLSEVLDGYVREQTSRATNFHAVVKYVDFNTTTFFTIIPMCQGIDESLHTGVFWVKDSFFESTFWPEFCLDSVSS